MNLAALDVSVRGRRTTLPSFQVGSNHVLVKGRLLRIAEIFDEYWVQAKSLPRPDAVLRECGALRPKPDLLTFTQRVPQTEPLYNYPHTWDNVAVIPLTTYDAWLRKQVTSATRRNIKAAANRGIVVRAADYDEAYVRGIMAIYNESPIRQGRRFWHYGKDYFTVQAENGTYADRSTFLAAYYENEMIGYLKMVWDDETVAVMQVISKIKHYDKRPNNALLAEAVKQACARGMKHLLYEAFVYGNKVESSLTEYKRSNGFVRMDVPRYFVPLTWKGALALRLGLQTSQKDRLPAWLTSRWVDIRSRWYARSIETRVKPADAGKSQ